MENIDVKSLTFEELQLLDREVSEEINFRKDKKIRWVLSRIFKEFPEVKIVILGNVTRLMDNSVYLDCDKIILDKLGKLSHEEIANKRFRSKIMQCYLEEISLYLDLRESLSDSDLLIGVTRVLYTDKTFEYHLYEYEIDRSKL